MSDCGTEIEVSGDGVWVKKVREKPEALEFLSKMLIEATDE